MNSTYKISLIGSPKTGKTTFALSLLGLAADYVPSDLTIFNGSGNYFIPYTTGEDMTIFNLRENNFSRADAAILLITKDDSFETIQTLILDFQKYNKDKPILICANKCDLVDQLTNCIPLLRKAHESGYPTFVISSWDKTNTDKPFRWLLRYFDDLKVETAAPQLCCFNFWSW